MPDVDAHAHRLEAPRDVVRLQIGSGDVEIERAQDLGEAAHPDAADADEVRAPNASAEHQDSSLAARNRVLDPFAPFAFLGRGVMRASSRRSIAMSCAA